jgi:hypothetical protein
VETVGQYRTDMGMGIDAYVSVAACCNVKILLDLSIPLTIHFCDIQAPLGYV